MSELQVTSAIHNDLAGKVVRIGDHAVTGGFFADVWQGQYQGTLVAIKVICITFVNADKLTKVSVDFGVVSEELVNSPT